jgi:hypothetical protein
MNNRMNYKMTNTNRIRFVLLTTGLIVAMLGSALARQDPIATQPGPVSFGKPIEIVMSRGASTTTDLRSLPQTPPDKVERPEREDPDIERTAIQRGVNPPPEVSTPSVPAQNAPAPPPIMNFDGLDFANWGAGHPPDTNGDVGPTYYIQTINTSIGIFRKSDGVRVAAFTFNVFMSQGNFGDVRDSGNFGDPVVLYDTFEDRWVITDFAFTLSGGNVVNPPGSFQVIAVSKSGDPVSGGWNFYSINTVGGLGDYPKLGIWPDGLYMSVNMFGYPAGAAFQGPRVYAFNKQQMYAGKPTVQVVSFDGPPADFTLLPSNARLQAGTPPQGTPNYFISTWEFINALTVYKFHVNWNSISTSTFTGPDTPLASTSWPNAAVPNALSSGGNALDVLQIRAMVQNQYTNLGGVESLWTSHTVRRGNTSGLAAPRWYQVNVTGGTVNPNIPQAATWDPDGANVISRFMPSVAVDRAGNMALGYSTSSSTTKPALKYAGRLSTDPINTLGQTETVLFQGTGTQTGNCGSSTCIRWGDYSAMTLDPDGCTFWYTNEYYAVDGLNHQTRIGSFSFSQCTPVGSGGTISGTVTATAGGAPLSGATIQFGARSTTTNGSGFYSFLNIPAGTYPTITASFPGYTTGTASNIGVTDGGTTTVDFSLATAATNACLTDTTQADFQTGVPTNVDLITSPGDVLILNAPNIDQQNTTLSNSGVGITTTTWGGQTFTAGITGQLTRVDINLFCSTCTGTFPNLTLSLRATSANLPTGADIASATVAGNNSGSSSFFTATFSSPPTLTAGTVYAIIIRPTANPSAGVYAITRSATNVYAGGQRVSSADSGGTWTAPLTSGQTTDAGFKTYIKTGFTSGNLISSLKDSNPLAGLTPIWSTLSWNASTPANTMVRFQVAGSNSDSGPFSFVGPDGTAATFFTTSGASLAQFYGLRYLQYKAYLDTTDNTTTPTLNDVTVCYADTDCSGSAAITLTPAEVCANSTGNTASGPAGAASYSWSITNGTMTGGAASQTLTYTAGASGTVGLALDIVEAGGCHKSGSTNVTINPIPATPTITPGGPTTFCPGGSVTLTSSGASGNQWYLNGNPIGGATNQNYIATAAGDYTVTVTTSGCTSAASAITTVTVADNAVPVLSGCTNLSAFTASNACTAVVTYTQPTANDNCDGARPVTCNPVSGTAFAKGVTTVSCSATDTSNNTGNCTFTVTVTDNVPPVFSGCTNVSAFTASNSCDAVVNYTQPTATDNCDGARTVTCSPTAGSVFPKGVTTVSCSASDTSGNPANCTFTVTVTDNVKPVLSGCNNVTANAASNACTAVVTYTQPTATDNCDGARTVTCSPASGSTFSKGVTTVSCSASDTSSNTGNCTFTVTVNDTTPPVITCPSPVVHGTDPGVCNAKVTYPNATATDNCTGVGTPTCTPASGTTFQKGVTTVTCNVTDASNNPASCTFTVTVNDTENPTVTCPNNMNFTTPGNSDLCGFVFYATPSGSDNCGVQSVVCAPASGFCFPVGMTTVTCTVTDTSGNKGQCTFKIMVSNPCTITCPPDQTASTGPGATQCGTAVTYPAPTITGGACGTVTCSPASGSFFPVGMTTVTCTTNGPSCSFKVTVVDNTPPVFPNCAGITMTAQPSCPFSTSTAVSFTTPTATDNCPGTPSVTCVPPTGSMFPVGTTTVTCTATDASNNTATCMFGVNVFSFCLQDDSSPGNVVFVNAITGDYVFCSGGVQIASGRGTLTVRGCQFGIEHVKGDRRVHIGGDTSANNGVGGGTAFIQKANGHMVMQLTDKNMTNNICSCSSAPASTNPRDPDPGKKLNGN